MLSVTYPISVETSIGEYISFLYRQGGMTRAYQEEPHKLLGVISNLRSQVASAKLDKSYDLAFVKSIRIIRIIEEEELRKRLQGSDGQTVRTELREACNTGEEIRNKYLPLLLEQQNTALRESEAERQRTVTLQMMEDDADNEEEKQKQHNERRRKLLDNEQTEVEAGQKIEAPDAGEDFHRQRQARLAETNAARELELQAKLFSVASPSPVAVNPVAAAFLLKPARVATEQPSSLLRPAPVQSPTSQPSTPPAKLVVHPPSSIPSKKPSQNSIVQLPRSNGQIISRNVASWKFNSTGDAVPRRGLVNLGNTCYMNSMLQCLAQTEIGFYVTSQDFSRDFDDHNRESMIQAFAFVMREMDAQGIVQPINASRLKAEVSKKNELFQGKSQQDANEFLRALLDGMHDELNKNSDARGLLAEIDNATGDDHSIAKAYWDQYKQRNSSLIVNMFAFQERSSILCPNCNNNPRSFTPVMGIEVPIPALSRDVCVEDCLAAYCKKEVLDVESLYNCSSCKRKVPATKQLSFHTLPRTLVVTLKRFRSTGNFSDKVTTAVAFQPILDMHPFTSNTQWESSTKYKLIGVVNHQGNIHGGHYTADVMGMRDGVWRNFSDEVVRPATEPSFKLAYTLFYLLID